MNYNSPEKERSNNILFVLFLFLYLFLTLIQMEGGLYVFILFSGMIYGFISKNPLKSFFIGPLPLAILVGLDLTREFIRELINPTSVTLSEYLLSNLPAIGIVFVYLIFVYLILGRVTATFMSQESEDNKKKRIHYIALSVFVILSVFLYFTFFLFYSFEDGSFGFDPTIGLVVTLIGLSGYFMA
jgi:hypothetical protein